MKCRQCGKELEPHWSTGICLECSRENMKKIFRENPEMKQAFRETIEELKKPENVEKMAKDTANFMNAIQALRSEKKMKKLFISQPMRGKTDEEILAVREKAIKSAEKQIGEPVEVIDSFFQSAPVDAKPLWYLGESLKLLAEADVAYFAKGWDEARGCKIENTCAIEYGIETIIEDYAEG